MTETVGPPQERSGMSKGCLVSIIVVSAIVVLGIGFAVYCYYNLDKLVKTATVTLISQVKSEVAKTPPEGVDTAQFNALASGFITKFNADTTAVDKAQIQNLMQTIRTVMEDNVVDSAEVETLEKAMFRYYPELGEEYDLSPAYDSEMNDTTADTTSN